jgi:energy-coupling factor transporter ATP-binding protein EcfA2
LLDGVNANGAASVDAEEPLRSLTARRTDVTAALDTVLQTATAPDPDVCYADVAEFVLAFRSAVGGPHTPSGTGIDDTHLNFDGAVLASLRAGPANPYKGLRPFEEADAPSFFGRDQLVDELVRHLTISRFVAVVGPSGSGKSSVVRAGLIPHLRRGGAYVTTIIPGAHPMDELETALRHISTEPVPMLLEQLAADEGAIGRCVERVLPDDHRDLVLIIDQFEELYTITDREGREQFLTGIAAAVGDERGRLRVLATLRADFIDRPLLDPSVITTAAGGPALAASVRISRSVLPMKARTSPMWSRTWTAVVGSFTAGESALFAMSTIMRRANAGSWSNVRSSPSAIIPSSSSAAPWPNSPP